jgi:hypothetical protein
VWERRKKGGNDDVTYFVDMDRAREKRKEGGRGEAM